MAELIIALLPIRRVQELNILKLLFQVIFSIEFFPLIIIIIITTNSNQFLENSPGENDGINNILNENSTAKCKSNGFSKPTGITIRSNRGIFNRTKRSFSDGEKKQKEEKISLLLLADEKGKNDNEKYSLLSFNKAGIIEKKFKINVIGC